MGFSRRMSCLGFICVWFVAIFRTSDGGSITWHEPPPVKTETDNTVPSTADSIQLFKGRSASLSWNFTLTGETFASVSLESKTETVASIQPAFGVVAVTPGFENRFNVSWIDSQKATLIIFNVITDDSGDFSCKTSSVLQAAIKVWTRKIQVAVVDPARITATSGNQTVDEGDNVTLGCTVVGEPTPIKTWTKLSDNSTVNSTIHITGKQDEGVYRCTASNGVGSPASADVFITVQNYRPENTNFATSLNDNITVVNTDFNLICSAQANPPAKYRFYKEQESLFNTTTGSNVAEHTTSVTERINQVQFSCTPFNDLYGDGPTDTITVTVHYPPIVTAPSPEPVKEGNGTTLFCNATGNPTPNITWTKKGNNSVLSTTNTLNLTNLMRGDNGAVYTCKAENVAGPGEATTTITVLYKPYNVTLVANTTGNKNCSESVWANFTCKAFDANPVVKTYWLYGNENGPIADNSGTWIQEISEKGKHVYSCLAQHLLENVTSAKNVTLTVNVRATVNLINDNEPVKEGGFLTVTEGRNVYLKCDASGFPDPTITWKKDGVAEPSGVKWFNITNISRNQSGQYRCLANNTCGNPSSVTSIDVQYEPENVRLNVNISNNKVCAGIIVFFTCAADANPLGNYTLYENHTMLNMSRSGERIKAIHKHGQVIYTCEANNSVGSGKSSSIALNVEIPVYVQQINREINVTEGGNVTEVCNASAGIFPAAVTWIKDGVVVPTVGKWLNIINISRNETGQYKCLANNTCGNNSTLTRINVQYEPENVRLNVNISNNKVCAGIIVLFTCTADANPEVNNFTLYENDTMLNMSRSGERIKAISKHGRVTYTCEGNNSVGSKKSSSITLNVEVPVYVEQINREINVTEGENVTEVCNASAGNFPPTVTWIKDGVVVPTVGKWLNIINISRNNTGQYKCFANNTCGNNSTLTRINVQYEPENVRLNVNISNNKVCAGIIVLFTCTADANPEVNNFTLYENDTMLNMSRSGERIKAISKHGRVTYTCEGNNSVGSKKSSSITLNVEVPVYVQQINREINVAEGRNVTEVCNASAGIFPPTVTWTKDDDVVPTVGKWLNIINISRNKTGQYKCLANNTCGNNSTSTRINVQYPPSVTDDSMIFNVSKGKMATLSCPVDGNPAPSITWHEGNDTSSQILHRGEKWTIQTTSLNIKWHWYSCSARNNFGTVNATVRLLIVPPTVTSPTATSPITSKETSPDIKLTLTVTDRDCNESPQVKQGICVELSRIIVNGAGVTHCKVENTRCGSVIVDFVLRFNQSVSADEVVSALKTAAEQNEFRSYTVDPESIKQTSSSPTKEPPCKESLFKDAKCELKVHIVVIIAVGGALVIACVIGGATYYWVHKKRKCRKDPRIHNSDDQEALQSNQSGVDENAHSQVNGGYADSGPPSANGTRADEQTGANGTDAPVKQQQQEQVQGAPPTHAVVDKSTKKKKKEEEKKKKEEEKRRKEEEKKKKNEAEQNIPQYAVVDKSQRKKKEVVEDAYAQVDMSRKSKKKPKPGEVLYADLGDFQPKQMPAVSTSPETLPPVKRPPAYQETQYADITQFLKGDATLPDANNSQGTEMTYANVEGGKGTPKENANEEKPKETANGGGNEEKPKETPL